MNGQYILIDHEPVRVDDILVWGEWMEEKGNRRVAQTTVWPFWVSTVFLGIDHNWWYKDGPPLLFETMVFLKGQSSDFICKRCSTWGEALQQHHDVLRTVRNPWWWLKTLVGIGVEKIKEGKLWQKFQSKV